MQCDKQHIYNIHLNTTVFLWVLELAKVYTFFTLGTDPTSLLM